MDDNQSENDTDCRPHLPLARPNMRIGLLGGSFDPPHQGHREISLAALKLLGLDQVWWLISPINPLKVKQPWPLSKRILQCEVLANHPKIKITGFECQRKSFYTRDSLCYLKRRFYNTDFVWIMGADNLTSMHHWYRWHDIYALMPLLVVDRPDYHLCALSAPASHFYRANRVKNSDLSTLPGKKTPCWGFLTLPLNAVSSTEIREKHHVTCSS